MVNESKLQDAFEIIEVTEEAFSIKGEGIVDPEKRSYLLLLVFNDEGKTFEVITGRRAAFDYIVQRLDLINILESAILSDSMTVDEIDSHNVYNYMTIMLKDFYPEEDIDLRSYIDPSQL